MLNVKVDLSELERKLGGLSKKLKKVKGVKAGYFNNASYPNSLKLSENALIQEYGTEHIPPRPFLRNSLKRQKEWVKFIKENFDVSSDNPVQLEQVMKMTGEMMKDAIKDSIDSNIPPANRPSTVKAKGSSHTLIDTGTLRNSVHSEVIKSK